MSQPSLYQHIYSLRENSLMSKHEQLVEGVINSINDGSLKRGDKLPSINEMVSELKYARKTIVKAYEELKDRGIVESKKLKGYFIASEETSQTLKVALILYAFHGFQEDFYNNFRKGLGPNVQLDVFFHHNNESLLEAILANIDKKYGMYVVAPIQSEAVAERLKQFPPEKLLLVDRYLFLGKEYAYITQEFEQTTFNKLTNLLTQIQQYEKLVLFYREDADYPTGIRKGFERFLKTHKLAGEIRPSYEPNTLERGHAYIFISDNNLYRLLKDCIEQQLTLGSDIGVIAHNDNLVKGILAGGITTISANFADMARMAARSIIDKTPVQQTIPTKLIRRNSL